MAADDPLMKQLITTFSEELESLLEVITQNVKKSTQETSALDWQQINEEISRSGRNIKVSAWSIGLEELGRIAELLEKLFNTVNPAPPALIRLTRDAVEGMREALQCFIDQKPLPEHLHQLLSRLDKFQHPVIEESAAEEKTPVQAELILPESDVAEQDFFKKILATFNAELQENLIVITNDLLQLEKGNNSNTKSSDLLAEIFRAAHNIKGSARGVGAQDVAEIAHHIETLFAAIQKGDLDISSDLVSLCLQSIDYMNEAMRCFTDNMPLPFNLQNHLQQLSLYSHLPLSSPASTLIESSEEPSRTIEIKTPINEFDSIRVSLHNLDHISADMEEIQAIKISLEEHYSDLNTIHFKIDSFIQSWKKNLLPIKGNFGQEDERFNTLLGSHLSELSELGKTAHLIQRELRISVHELSTLLNELQDEIRMIRLIPVNSQLHYLPRNIRDLAQELHKEVTLEIKNNDVKIDKMIMDGLKDPLMHLLRNAVDHGIEDPKTRQEAGKPAQGTISIEVSQEDHQIVFKITDDGAGINTEDIKQIALKKNIITTADLEHMKPGDIMDLIFRPGFSTREVPTNISGRGVGLDVVHSNLTHLKGQIHVESKPGQGTAFFLRVPITLTTERGLIISCSKQSFVLLTHSVETVLLLKKGDIFQVEGSAAILVKEEPVLLCSLERILHLIENKEKNNNEYCSVVVIKKDEKRVALLVDEILGEREMVLKPLQEPLHNMPCVIGATLTGSNQINFVLNSSELIKRAYFN